MGKSNSTQGREKKEGREWHNESDGIVLDGAIIGAFVHCRLLTARVQLHPRAAHGPELESNDRSQRQWWLMVIRLLKHFKVKRLVKNIGTRTTLCLCTLYHILKSGKETARPRTIPTLPTEPMPSWRAGGT